ncbi:response regulator [Leptobacterium flavescens]|uniref:Response regulator n=1 Tax=Leptobacterium flavescens TaxID=472055 RepID=A0A6P0ULU6_9FLAO|nr:LytTR family DNA-binding domain-containing protein [Leptobacterium flavescens]NER14204.1 response regulator [Leptobacterium flavescens]
MKIKCLIIDDEPSSQNVLKNFIEDLSFLELSHVCNNAIDAIEYLKADTSVELLFLDINMPKISGLSFYRSLQNPPDVIFTTAYPQYAVEGFEVNAVDYLLKPFSFDRFFTAVNKVLDKRKEEQAKDREAPYLMIKSNKVLHKVLISDIFYVEALGDYVKVHLKDSNIVTNSTFTNILEALKNAQFIRTHKSFAINPGKLNSVSGNQAIIGPYTVPIGQKYKADFIKIISG